MNRGKERVDQNVTTIRRAEERATCGLARPIVDTGSNRFLFVLESVACSAGEYVGPISIFSRHFYRHTATFFRLGYSHHHGGKASPNIATITIFSMSRPKLPSTTASPFPFKVRGRGLPHTRVAWYRRDTRQHANGKGSYS